MARECRVCEVELDNENWNPSQQKGKSYICKKCNAKKGRAWYKENADKTKENVSAWREANPEKYKATSRAWAKNNPDKVKAMWTRAHRKAGQLPFDENKECTSYFGIYIGEHDIAERVLNCLFKTVERMPYNNSKYDFVCDGKKIDVKSGCMLKTRNGWQFCIDYNTIADYFLIIAFDNREDLNQLHIWLIPGHVLNHLSGTTICPSTLSKWEEYELSLDDVITCCDESRCY